LRPDPSYRPDWRQQRLKAPAGTARAKIVAPELFKQFFINTDNAEAALYIGF
jgi:hypothetical protein